MTGYLEKKSENWFRSWTEKFCVLTNVGLIYYDDPQKKPRNLFPIIDTQIIQLSESVYHKKYVFKLKSFAFEIIMAAKSKDEFEAWMGEMYKLQEETEKKKEMMLSRKNIKSPEKKDIRDLSEKSEKSERENGK